MSENGYKPEPWIVDNYLIRNQLTGKRIAQIFEQTDLQATMTHRNIIVAAPELTEACQAAYNTLWMISEEEDVTIWDETLQQLKQALAKAKGES